MSRKGSPSVSRINSPLSAPGGGGGSVLTALTAAPAEVSAAAEIIKKMKGSLGNLGKTLDSLGSQTVQMIQGGGETEIGVQISSVRKDMENASTKQEKQIAEIQALLQEVLEHDVIEHLTELIQAGILKEIDAIVEEQVTLQLPNFIPQKLQDELQDQKKELEEVQKELYNSESRRANLTLRSHRLHEKVHALYNAKGEISAHFPTTLGDMFAISAETAKELLKDYDLVETKSREKDINALMQHCGIQYQLVATKEGAPIPCRIHPSTSGDGRT